MARQRLSDADGDRGRARRRSIMSGAIGQTLLDVAHEERARAQRGEIGDRPLGGCHALADGAGNAGGFVVHVVADGAADLFDVRPHAGSGAPVVERLRQDARDLGEQHEHRQRTHDAPQPPEDSGAWWSEAEARIGVFHCR